MKQDFWLIFTKRGVKKITKRKPTLGAHEYACLLSVQISDKYFERPLPKVLLNINEQEVVEPEVQIEQKTK